MTRIVAFVACALLLTGCGPEGGTRSDPVKVSGTVTGKNGKPVDKVDISFFVLSSDGTPGQFPVVNGKFSGTLAPGKYSFFFVEGKNVAAFNAIPEPYRQNSADHKIEISGPTDALAITLE